MSLPRHVVPSATYHITRRTILRQMLFRPDHLMTRILVYLLAVIARRHGIEVHAFCAMSDHIHLVATDVRGTLPTFLHSFHRTIALCTGALRERHEVVWDKSATSVVQLETATAVVEAIAYVLANPVAAGLVESAHEWPGAKTVVGDLGSGCLRAARPQVYLNAKNPEWPPEAALEISLPPHIEPENAGAFREQVAAELARIEAHARGEMHRLGRRFLGPKRAAQVPPTDRATSDEPGVGAQPRSAVGRGQPGALRRAASALHAFHVSYRAALARWCEGLRDAIFPAGTWWMRMFHRVSVAPPLLCPFSAAA